MHVDFGLVFTTYISALYGNAFVMALTGQAIDLSFIGGNGKYSRWNG